MNFASPRHLALLMIPLLEIVCVTYPKWPLMWKELDAEEER